jgi:hypothetical protein
MLTSVLIGFVVVFSVVGRIEWSLKYSELIEWNTWGN